MARIAMDTRAQNSWKEQIEKEAMTRIMVKLQKDEKADDDDWFERKKYKENSPTQIAFNPNEMNYPPKPVKPSPSQQAIELTRQLQASGANLLSDMKKPEEKVTKLLYEGFTKEEKGRYAYMKERKKVNPEEKYDYPLTSAFEYGWKLNEVGIQYKTPANGRTKIVEDTFHTRNGVFPN